VSLPIDGADRRHRARTLIIGGSRGVGRATALELARRGHDIALAFRSSRETAETVVTELPEGARGFLVQGDIAVDGTRIVDAAAAALGGLDAVVVTAVPVITGRLSDASREDAALSYDVVVNGFREVALAARGYLAATGGNVIATRSLGSNRYASYYGVLGPAKAALESMIRYLAVEFGRDGVRVNAVSPCLIDDLTHVADAPDVLPFLSATAKRTPLNRRLARPDDIACVIAGLLSSDFNCVTGQVIVVDGGYSLLA
jgi:NAD(P)-dependent dehydrogenase (short-subunit alcohol dehydrogenase family)